MRKAIALVAVAVLTAGLLVLWLRTIDLAAMGRDLAGARLVPTALVAALALVAIPVRAWRWRVVLEAGDAAARGHGPMGPSRRDASRSAIAEADLGPDSQGQSANAPRPAALGQTERLPIGQLSRITAIGYLVTFTAPGRAGEVVRPALLVARSKVPAGLAAGSILIERLLDLALVLILGLLGLALSHPRNPGRIGVPAGLALAAMVVAWVVALTLHRRGHLEGVMRKVVARLPSRWHERLLRLVTPLLASLDALQPARLAALLGLSALIWIPAVLAAACGLSATGIEVHWAAPMALVLLLALGIAVPTPGGIGGYEAAMTFGLTSLYGADPARAAAAAVLTHVATVVPVILIGLYSCAHEGLTAASLRGARAGAPVGPPPST